MSDDAALRNELQTMLFAAAGGNEMAWRDLVDAYAKRVYALLHSQCSDPDLADEITQSTFCTIVVKLAEYTELGKFEAWLFRIAMNRLRDEMRRRKRQAVSMETDVLTSIAGQSPRGSGPRSDDREIAALRDAMAQLKQPDREVIQLRHYGGLSFRQISDLLDQPLGTVLARQHRALQKLADLMQQTNEQDRSTAKDSAKSTPGKPQ